MNYKEMFKPFGKLTAKEFTIIGILQIAFAIFLFQVFRSPVVPRPLEILSSLVALLQSTELYDNLIVSLEITIEAMIYSIVITTLLVYASRIPFFRLVADFVSKCRYLTLTGLVYLFTVLTSNVGQLKMSLLIFGIVPFFVTSFLSVVSSIPEQQIDKAFVNRMDSWQALYEVVVVGRLDQLLEVMRQNFAISWIMITTAESYDMSQGGIGTMLINSNKHLMLGPVFAMLIIVLALGLCFDWGLSKLRIVLFKYI